jgi:hypothetical protein
MPIVTARMHLSGKDTGVGEPVLLCHRECIHVCTKAHTGDLTGLGLTLTPNESNDTRPTYTREHLVGTHFAQGICHTGRGALFLKLEFRVRVDVASKRCEFL